MSETTISTFPMGTADVDNPSMDVDGQVVHIAWNDNAGGPNDCFSITSLDGGNSFSAPFNFPVGSGVPVQPFSQLLGVDVYVVAGVVDLSLADIWAGFTDPVLVGR